ncbi:MAG: right-handed parallel beta-helix repeat-containing protein [Bacteroidales bacterium]
MSSLNRMMLYAAILLLVMILPSYAPSENATWPGEISTPYPTIRCLAVEWLIRGDDNLNGTVEVSYRVMGDEKWLTAMPLVRIPAGNTRNRTTPTYTWSNKFSGSIFNLKPGTGYEIRLTLHDPDGGRATEIVKATTRPVPGEAPDSRIIAVNPRTLEKAALQAEPGDVLLLSPGYYESFTLAVDGEPGKPIVLRADNAHPVIGSTFNEIHLEHRKHVIIDGLTVWGPVYLRWAEDVAIRHCTIESQFGIIAQEQPGCKNCYIADNTVRYKIPWVAESTGSGSIWGGPANIGEGIELTGPGNVICYNRVSGYRDCISTMEDLWVYDQMCIDIYNNDISEGPDDGIEIDFAMNNCRIMDNRITNCGMGLSSQPGLGGPVYFIRNVMYNIAMAPFKLERLSYGNLFFHNTVVKSGDGLFEHHGQNEFFRTSWLNNLCIGGSGGGKNGRYSSGEGLAVSLPGYNNTCTFDYNAVGVANTPFRGKIGDQLFETIEELNRLTGAAHSVQVDMDVFGAEVEFPDPVYPERQPQDLRISGGSPAEDAALLMPNINDDFTGKAPDMGAYEIGKPMPHYGPRPRGVDENSTH